MGLSTHGKLTILMHFPWNCLNLVATFLLLAIIRSLLNFETSEQKLELCNFGIKLCVKYLPFIFYFKYIALSKTNWPAGPATWSLNWPGVNPSGAGPPGQWLNRSLVTNRSTSKLNNHYKISCLSYSIIKKYCESINIHISVFFLLITAMFVKYCLFTFICDL